MGETCPGCGEIFPDLRKIKHCSCCETCYCGTCDGLERVRRKCNGDCVVSLGYVDSDDEEKDCTCDPNVVEMRLEEPWSGAHYICDECRTVKDSNEVTPEDIIEFLLPYSPYKTIDEVTKVCRDVKKQKVTSDDDDEEL